MDDPPGWCRSSRRCHLRCGTTWKKEESLMKLMSNMRTVVIILAVVLLLGLNILFPFLQERNASYPDLTPEGLYTLTDAMVETCGKLQGNITITFCAEPDMLLGNYQLRYVYIMAMQLANRFDHITVETYDITKNPTAVNRFKTTSATQILPSHVIVSCENRYRILGSSAFWTLGEESTSNTDYYSFNGEYKLATAFLSITSVVEPVVCFTYGHGEHIYVDPQDTANAHLLSLSDPTRSAFYGMMRAAGMKVQYIDLDAENVELPEDCVMVVMDGPTTDYAYGNPNSIDDRSALRVLEDFMLRRQGSLMLFKDPVANLEHLENFAEDWGISYNGDSYVRDDRDHVIADAEHKNQTLIATLIRDESSVANAIYADVVALAAAPRMVVKDSGSVSCSWVNDYVGTSGGENVNAYYFDFFTSSSGAHLYTPDGLLNSQDPDTHALAGLSFRMKTDDKSGDTYFSYFFGAASTALTSNAYLENRAYCNYDVMFATARYISRVDEYASMELGGTSLNSSNMGGKVLVTDTLSPLGNTKYDDDRLSVGYYPILERSASGWWTVLLALTPVLLACVMGAVILVKRKNR